MRWGPNVHTHRHTNTHINPHVHPIQEQTLPVYLQNISRIWTLLTISCAVIQATAFCLDYWYSLLTSFQFLSSAPTCPPSLFSIMHSPEWSLKSISQVPSLFKTPLWLRIPLRVKGKFLEQLQCPTWPDMATSLALSSQTTPFAVCTPAALPVCCFSNTRMLLPQGLCTCCSLCLNSFGGFHLPFRSLTDVNPSEGSSLTTLNKPTKIPISHTSNIFLSALFFARTLLITTLIYLFC